MNSHFLFANPAQEYYEKGFKALQDEEFTLALEYFNKVQELNPGLPQTHYMIGMAHMQKKDSVHDAIAAFEEAVKLNPKYAEAHNQLGVIYATLIPDNDLAEEYLLKAVASDPKFARGEFSLGWFYMSKIKDYAKAKEHLEKAVILDPNLLDAKYYLGFAYIALGEKARAIRPMSELRVAGANDYAQMLQGLMNSDAETIAAQLEAS